MGDIDLFFALTPLYYFGKMIGFIQFSIIGKTNQRGFIIYSLDIAIFGCQILLDLYFTYDRIKLFIASTSYVLKMGTAYIITWMTLPLEPFIAFSIILCGVKNKQKIYFIIIKLEVIYNIFNVGISKLLIKIVVLFILNLSIHFGVLYHQILIIKIERRYWISTILMLLPLNMECFIIIFVYLLNRTMKKINETLGINDEINCLNKNILLLNDLYEISKNVNELLNYTPLRIYNTFLLITHVGFFYHECKFYSVILMIKWIFFYITLFLSNIFNIILIVYFCEKLRIEVRKQSC